MPGNSDARSVIHATDGFPITSREPDDIPAFTEALIEAIDAARVEFV